MAPATACYTRHMDPRIPTELAPGAPAIRAAQLQQNIGVIEALPESMRDDVMACWGDDGFANVRGASRLAWLPLEYDIVSLEKLYAFEGPAGIVRMAEGSLNKTTETNLLAPVVKRGATIFGASGRSVLKLMPTGFPLVYRDCGSFEKADIGDGEGTIRWGKTPALLDEYPLYVEVVGIAMVTLMKLMGSKDAKMTYAKDGDGWLYHMSWW